MKVTNLQVNANFLKIVSIALIALATTTSTGLAKSGVSPEQAIADAKIIQKGHPTWNLFAGSGFSMDPFFGDNSLLFVEKTPISKMKPGMVAVFTDHQGDTVAHTVVRVTPEGLVTKGLNNSTIDPTPVTHERLIGAVIGRLEASASISSVADLPVALGKTY